MFAVQPRHPHPAEKSTHAHEHALNEAHISKGVRAILRKKKKNDPVK